MPLREVYQQVPTSGFKNLSISSFPDGETLATLSGMYVYHAFTLFRPSWILLKSVQVPSLYSQFARPSSVNVLWDYIVCRSPI